MSHVSADHAGQGVERRLGHAIDRKPRDGRVDAIRFTPRPCYRRCGMPTSLQTAPPAAHIFSWVLPSEMDNQVKVESPLRHASAKNGVDVTLYPRDHYCYYVFRPLDIISICRAVGVFSGLFSNRPADSLKVKNRACKEISGAYNAPLVRR